METPRRRRTALDAPACNYASVGATGSPDLLMHPPKGFAAAEYRARLGSGEARFERSIARLMRFGVQRGAGLHVRDVTHASRSLEAYRSLHLDERAPGDDAGVGAADARTSVARPYAHLFDAADDLLVRPGTTADIVTKTGPFTFRSPIRVLSVTAEPRRFGFTSGTLPGGPEAGEQSIFVTWERDNSVWITIREFVRAGNWWIRLVWPYADHHRKGVVRKYLAALHPATPVPPDD